jgi:hypothetical protein
MTRKKSAFYTLTILIVATCSAAKAQSYKMSTFEGEKVTVTIQYKLMSSRTLAVAYRKDTVYLAEFFDDKTVHVWQNKFLQITYDTRGGSGLDTKSTVFISIVNGRMQTCLLVDSYAKLEGPNKKGLYQTTFNLIEIAKGNYQLLVNVRDKMEYADNRNAGYSNFQRDTLSFDPKDNTFYNITQRISGEFTIYDIKSLRERRQFVNGRFPGIVLGRRSYYYINENWLARSDSGTFHSDYFR